MLTTEAVGLAISIAKGLIKLGGRLDILLAESAAVQGPLIIPIPKFLPGPTFSEMLADVKKYTAETAALLPDPIGDFREKLLELLEQANNPAPDNSLHGKLLGCYRRIYPAKADPPAIDPQQEYLKELRRRLGTLDWDDPDVMQAAFYVAAGRDHQEIGYAARIALLVVDVLAEFGAENTGLFVRNEQVSAAVAAVLHHFSKPELETFNEWSPLLRHALSSTLNGLLDARGAFQGQSPWLDGLLVALARAREKAAQGDDFLIGLLRGRGYHLLIAEGIRFAGEEVGRNSSKWEAVASDFLLAAVPLVEADDGGFGDFFRNHWGDLLRAGFGAAAKHGPELLKDESPLLQQTLVAMIKALADTDQKTSFFSADTVLRMSEAALAAVAANPTLITAGVRETWLAALVASVAGTLADNGIRETFSREGIETIVKDALTVFAEQPELIMPGKDGSVAFDIVGDILRSVAKADSLTLLPLANAAVHGALNGLSKHPELVNSSFGPYLAELAGQMAELVARKPFTGIQASDLVSAAADAMLRNPVLFARWEENIAGTITSVVLQVAEDDKTRLVAGASLVQLVEQVLGAFARYGLGFIENNTLKQVGDKLTEVLTAGLIRAGKEVGRRLDQPDVPVILGELVIKLVKGEVAELDPESENFKKLFTGLAEAIAA